MGHDGGYIRLARNSAIPKGAVPALLGTYRSRKQNNKPELWDSLTASSRGPNADRELALVGISGCVKRDSPHQRLTP